MPKIWIDPGHGGTDPGAVANGIVEKNINLIVGLKLKELLEQKNIQVGITRTDDTYYSLTKRCDLANDFKADLFISVHHNAGKGDGYEVIHSIVYGVGKKLADIVAQKFAELGQNPHGSKAVYSRKGENGDYYAVIRGTKMPAIITEFAFIDTVDVKVVDSNEKLYKEAQAIHEAICKYLGV
jgi:N-acetylmuramoyl-L-alanine amidase